MSLGCWPLSLKSTELIARSIEYRSPDNCTLCWSLHRITPVVFLRMGFLVMPGGGAFIVTLVPSRDRQRELWRTLRALQAAPPHQAYSPRLFAFYSHNDFKRSGRARRCLTFAHIMTSFCNKVDIWYCLVWLCASSCWRGLKKNKTRTHTTTRSNHLITPHCHYVYVTRYQ